MTETETTETTETKDPKLAERHGYVDFDKIDDPEVRQQVQDRIHGLYQSNKDDRAALTEAKRLYVGMEKRVAEMEAKTQKETDDSRLEQVRTEFVKANEKGDYEAAAKLNEQMIDLKAPKPVQQPKTDDLEDRNTQMLLTWQSEMTDDGRIARPWAHRTHRGYNDTISNLTEVTEDPEFSSKGFRAILAEVDRRMTPKPKTAAPVSDGDATPTRTNSKTVQLTDRQKHVAIRLYSHMKPAEAIKAYAEANKKYGEE